MTAALRSKILALIEAHEGRCPTMYPDSKGNVTVGVGHLLEFLQSAVELPFFIRAAGAPATNKTRATTQQICAGWASVKHNRQPYPLLSLSDLDIDALLDADLTKFEPVMKQTFDVDDLPEPVELALWDMAFNLGSFHAFPNLVAAVRVGDWHRAAEECVRKDIGAERNAETQALFRQALTLPADLQQAELRQA